MRASLCLSATPASAVVRPELSGPEPRTSTSMPQSVAVTWMSSGLSAGLRISATAQAAAMAPSRPGARIGQRSMATMWCARGAVKPTSKQIARAAPRMQHAAPTALPVRINQRRDWRHQPGLGECLRHQSAFPQMIFGQRPVLHGAAAALGEMLADRRCAFVARSVNVVEMTAVGMAGDRLDRHQSRPATCKAHRPAQPAYRQCRRRDGRGARW